MAKPICPKCRKPVDTRGGYAKPTGNAIPREYGKGTYHFDCYVRAWGLLADDDDEQEKEG